MTPIIGVCLLGLVALTPCDAESAEVARVYSSYALVIPAEHLALVRGLYWAPAGRRGEANWSTMRLGLSRKPSAYVLAHETAHLVSAANLPLWKRYRERFWPDGFPVDGLPTRYARTNAAEDWAESVAHIITGDTHDMKERAAWLIPELPALRGH